MKDIKIFLEKKRTKGNKRPEKDQNFTVKKKKKNGVSIIRNISKNYPSIEEIVI